MPGPKKDLTEYHSLHIRLKATVWRRLRRAFPNYGDLKIVVTRAIEDFLDKWEDLDVYLAKCERLRDQIDKEKRFAPRGR